jgi:hypothetical protein
MLASALATGLAGESPATPQPPATPAPAPCSATPVTARNLPPLPEGVAELRFADFFKTPVGPRGLELTDRLRSLDGRRVRLLGFMVRQTDPLPHCFLLAPRPVTLHEHEYGFADELPASTVHVFTPTNLPPAVPFTPDPLLLTGTLGVGNRNEPSGRVSLVRLQLDPPTEAQRQAWLDAPTEAAPHPTRGAEVPHGHAH